MFAYQGAHIFDGQDWHENASLVVDGSRIVAIGAVPPDASTVALPKGYIVPGFVDLQVNGGGGHLIGPATQLAGLEVVLNTHARFGVTGLLPTLITDTDAVMDRILATGAEAARHNLK